MPLNDLIGYFEQLLAGAVITIELAFSGYALALTVGTSWALSRRLENPMVTAVWRVYASIFMGVPSVLVIFLFYYGGSAIIGGLLALIGTVLAST
jgi:His/Glu/Gln/Arg/opine family amino acid ABC transporter permease subunit